jgi:D-alanine-D-alanine ligase
MPLQLTGDELVDRSRHHELVGKTVGIMYGAMSEEDRLYIENAPQAEWSLTALTEALHRLGAHPVHINPTDEGFVRDLPRVDVLLLNCHGPYGEDGRIQGLLDYLGVPYTSCGVLASAVGLDKLVSKAVFRGLDIPTPQSSVVPAGSVAPDIRFPAMLKAVDGGSSVGVALVHHAVDLDLEVQRMRDRGFSRLFIEEFVPGRSITVSVLATPHGVRALPALESTFDAAFYDEASKLGSDGETPVEYKWPGDLPITTLAAMDRAAVEVYEFLECRGAIRVDFIVDSDGQHWALEINTIPGLQLKSNLPEAARLAGVFYDDLVAHLVLEAIERSDAWTPPWTIRGVKAGMYE